MQEVEDEWEDEEVEGNGGTQGRRRAAHFMRGHDMRARDRLEPCDAILNHDDTNLTNKRIAHSRVSVHVRCVEGVLGLGGHVVIGVVFGVTTQT